jgi:hypothetical protein
MSRVISNQMTPERAPFDEALKILADLIAERYLRVLTEKNVVTPAPETKHLPGTSADQDDSEREK